MSDQGTPWGGKWGCLGESLQDICECWLWWQFRDKTNWQILCAVMTKLFSQLDDKLRYIERTRGVDGAVEGQLDAWGAMVDERRNGMTDDLYRKAIKAKARAISSTGTLRDLDAVARLVLPNSDVTFQDFYPACIRLFYSDNTTDEEKSLMARLIVLAVGRGICTSFISVDPDGVFEFSYLEDDLSVLAVDRHWSHTDGDIDPATTAGFAYRE